jgi:hypothetical protein
MARPYHSVQTANDEPQRERYEYLSCWKEIAFFLNRGVRTVQQWERAEGLPVHRHNHSKRGTVLAYPAEIRAWLMVRQESPIHPESAAVTINRTKVIDHSMWGSRRGVVSIALVKSKFTRGPQ